jgi:hypothetical protein
MPEKKKIAPKTKKIIVKRTPRDPPLANLTAERIRPIIPSTDNTTPKMRFSILTVYVNYANLVPPHQSARISR